MYIGQAQLLFYAYVYFMWCVVNVVVATEKGRSNSFVFFTSLFFTPFLVYLYLLAIPSIPKQEPRQTDELAEQPPVEQQKTQTRRNPLTQR